MLGFISFLLMNGLLCDRFIAIFTEFLQGLPPFLPHFSLLLRRLRIRCCHLWHVQWSDEMTTWIVLGGLGALALAIYLLYALLNAEKF